jgi:tRNA (guanine26-N2/guanine27-N2)-dimethyltransferase
MPTPSSRNSSSPSASPVPATNDYDPKQHTSIQEGKARVLVPIAPEPAKPHAGGGQPATAAGQSVFYNPVQQYNRDLSVIAIRVFAADYVARAAARDSAARKPKRAKKRAAQRESGAEKEREESPTKRRRVDEGYDAGKMETEAEEGDNSFEDGGISDEVLLVAEKSLDGAQNVTAGPESPDNKTESSTKEETQPRVSFSILDAFSGTGLRALRYAAEIPLATRITANDLSAEAVTSIRANLAHNGANDKRVRVTHENAVQHMHATGAARYTVIDLDPYGTAAPFLDAAVQAVADGGLLCVTCTDSGVFNSLQYLEKAHSLYGGVPTKGPHCHEGGLRLILHAVAAAAGKYGVAVEPLLSLSIDFYVRVFVRLRRAPADVKFLAPRTTLVYSCDAGCGAWTAQPLARAHRHEGRNGAYYKFGPAQGPTAERLCEHCGFRLHVCGPMWGGPLHNPEFVKRMLIEIEDLDPAVYGTLARARGMLATALEETELYTRADDDAGAPDGAEIATEKAERDTADAAPCFARMPPHLTDPHPFYVFSTALAKVVRVESPRDAQLISGLQSLGHRCVRSHCKPGSIKTDAPWSAVWAVMRAWCAEKGMPRGGKALREGMAGWRILNGAPTAQPAKGEEAKGEWEEVEWEDVRGDGGAELKVVKGDGAWKVLRRKRGETEGEKDAEAGEKKKKQRIVFDATPDARKRGKKGQRMVRYQSNPTENWGPMRKAKAKAGGAVKKDSE